MIRYIVPGFCLFHTRLTRRLDRVSWVIVNPLAILLLSYVFTDLSLPFLLVGFPLGFLCFLSIYETGYIENDVVTVKGEDRPTVRFSREEAMRIEESYWPLIAWKVAIALLLLMSLTLWVRYGGEAARVGLFVGCLVAARFFFRIHNSIRNRWNILTYLGLSVLKYLSLPLLFGGEGRTLELVLLTVTMFPLVRTVEHATKPLYRFPGLRRFVGNFDTFRVKYYCILFALAWTAALLWGFQPDVPFLLLYGYFLAFRIGALVAVRLLRYQRTSHTAYEDPVEP